MGKIGDLYYEILFKDGTSKGIKDIEDRIKKLNKEITLTVDAGALVKNIQGALNKPFDIQVNAKVSGLEALQSQIEKIASAAASTMSAAANSVSGTKSSIRSSRFRSDFPMQQDFIQSNQSTKRNREKWEQAMRNAEKASNDGANEWLRRTALSLSQKTAMRVTNLPTKGTEEWKAWQLEQQIKRSNKRSDVKEAVSAQQAELNRIANLNKEWKRIVAENTKQRAEFAQKLATARNEKESLIAKAEQNRAKILENNRRVDYNQMVAAQQAEMNRLVRSEKARNEKEALIAKAESNRAKILENNSVVNTRYERSRLIAQQRVRMAELRSEAADRRMTERLEQRRVAKEDQSSRSLVRRYNLSNGGTESSVIAKINRAIGLYEGRIKKNFGTNAEGEMYRKVSNGNVSTTRAMTEEDNKLYESLKRGIASLEMVRSQMEKVGKTTMTVTDLPKRGTAAYKTEAEMRALRVAESRSAYKQYFAEQDRLEKERRKEEIKTERERIAQEKAKQKEIDALIKQSRTAWRASERGNSIAERAGDKDKAKDSPFAAYAKGMASIQKQAEDAAGSLMQGKAAFVNSSQIAEMSREMNGWLQQYRAFADASRSINGQMGNMRQVMANNPGKAQGIGEQMAKLSEMRAKMNEAASVYKKAMSGDFDAQTMLRSGKYSAEWLTQIQEKARAAGDEVRRMTSGMQVTSYASNLRQVADELANVQSQGSRVAEVLGGLFSVYAAKEFFNNLVQIGGEFEKQKLALAAMFNSQTRADSLYGKIQALAVKSPFTFGELTSYTKQLAAYGIQYNQIYDTTKRLADISAAVGVPMSRIILAYGQVSTAKFLRGQELRQFTEAGIPLVEALANRFTKLKGEMVSADDVFEMISKREVKFEDVKSVLEGMTDIGGRFYNMQDTLSESLSGKWSNLQDSIEIMYSEIENSNKGFLKGIVEGMTNVVRHWQPLMNIGSSLLVLYGALIAKKKINYLMDVKIAAGNASVMAKAMERQAIVERETAAYNKQTAAINANSGARAKNALRNMGFNLASNGGSAVGIVKTTASGIYSKEDVQRLRNLQALRLHLTRMQRDVGVLSGRWRLFGLQASMAINRVRIGLVGLGNAMKSLLSWENAIMAVLMIATYFYSKNKQDEEEMAAHTEESIKGMKDSYNELYKFIQEHPIDVALKMGDKNEISQLLKDYQEQVENSPINISHVAKTASLLPDDESKLKYMRSELIGLNQVMKQLETTASATTAAIKDQTDHWYSDNLTENLNDYTNAVHKLESEYVKVKREDVAKSFAGIQNQVSRALQTNDASLEIARKQLLAQAQDAKMKGDESGYKNIISQLDEKVKDAERFKKELLGVVAEMKKAMDSGDLQRYFQLSENFQNSHPQGGINVWASNADAFQGIGEARARVAEARRTMIEDIETTMPTIEAALRKGHESIIKENGEMVQGEVFTLGNLTDQGHQYLVGLLQDAVNEGKVSQEAFNSWLAYIENKATAAKGSTWQQASVVFDDFMEKLKAKYKKEFEGKEFTGQFTEAQKEAIRQAIQDVDPTLQPYINKLQMFMNEHPVKVRIAYEMSMTNTGGSPLATSHTQEMANAAMNKAFGAVSPSVMDKWAAQDGESELAYIDRITQSAKTAAETAHRLKKIKVKDATTKAMIKKNENTAKEGVSLLNQLDSTKAKEVTDALNGEKENKKAQSAADKAESKRKKEESERLKKLRERISRLNDFKQMYAKYIQVWGEVEGMKRLMESGLFAAGFAPKGMQSQEDVNKWVAKEMGKVHKSAGSKTEDQRNVGEQALKAKLELQVEIDKNQLDKELKQLDRELKKSKKQWERYLMFKEVGLSQEQSVALSFGDGSKPTTEAEQRKVEVQTFLSQNGIQGVDLDKILKMDKDELNDYFEDPGMVEKLDKMVSAYRDAWEQIVGENDKMYKELIENAKSYDQKIADANYKHSKQKNAIDMGVAEYAQSGGKSGISPQVATRMYAENDQERNKAVGEVQMEQLRNTEQYLNFFNAITTMTIDEAMKIGNAIQAELTAKLAAGTISAKDYADEIGKIREQMEKVGSSKTESQATWQGGLKGRVEWQKQNAQDRWNSANNKYQVAQEAYKEAEKNGNEVDMAAAKVVMDNAQVEMDNASQDEQNAMTREERMENVSKGLGKFASAADSLTKFRDSLGDAITSFGGDTDSAGFQAFSTIVDSISTLASGTQDVMQKIMSGDFVGAAFSAITSPLNIITAFNKLHDQKLQRQIELSEERSKDIKRAADQIQNAIENSLGSDAAREDAVSAYKLLSEQMYAAGKSTLSDSYKKVYEAMLSSSKMRKNMAELYVSANGTSGLKGGQYRNQEEYDALKKEGFDTAESISAYGAQYYALVEQRKELESRMKAEKGKKNSSKQKIADYADELSDLNSQITQFKDTMLKDILGLDFKTWADNLSSNLVNAFKNGQDAAEAFSDSVNDMLSTITQNAIKQAVIAPYLNGLKKQVEEAYDINDPNSIDKVVKIIYDSKDSAVKVVEDANKIWTKANDMVNGSLSDMSSDSNTITGNSKGLTEETGSLIASYLNSLRADVAMNKGYFRKLMEENMPKVDLMMEAQLKELTTIARNSALIAENTAASASAVSAIKDTIGSVVTVGSGGKAVRIK